jgi:polyferredoxin
MDYIIGALAVYKTVHLLELSLPRPVETWVKVAASVLLSYGAAVVLWTDHLPLAGLVIASLASVIHAVLRLLTLVGDLVMRRTIR